MKGGRETPSECIIPELCYLYQGRIGSYGQRSVGQCLMWPVVPGGKIHSSRVKEERCAQRRSRIQTSGQFTAWFSYQGYPLLILHH